MQAHVIEVIKSLLPKEIAATQHETTKGLLFWPNDNLRLGPRYLIRLNYPLDVSAVDWNRITPYFNGGHEDTCRAFLGGCNGFSFSWRFSAPGILTHSPYDRQGLSFLNVPYDLGGQSYRSYPQFAPSVGYFVAKIRLGLDNSEICDIVTPDGRIVYGEFRQNTDVLGEFKNIDEWLNERVPQALQEVKVDLAKGDGPASTS